MWKSKISFIRENKNKKQKCLIKCIKKNEPVKSNQKFHIQIKI